MKRKRPLITVCALVALVAVLVLLAKRDKGTPRATSQSLVIVTQDGKITLVPQSSYGQWTIVARVPKPATNAPSGNGSSTKLNP